MKRSTIVLLITESWTYEDVDGRTALALLQRRQRRGTTVGQEERSCGSENFMHDGVKECAINVRWEKTVQCSMPVSLTAQHVICNDRWSAVLFTFQRPFVRMVEATGSVSY